MSYIIKITLSYVVQAFLVLLLVFQVLRSIQGGMIDLLIGLVFLFICVLGVRHLHQWRKEIQASRKQEKYPDTN